jgi:hypothetical protein
MLTTLTFFMKPKFLIIVVVLGLAAVGVAFFILQKPAVAEAPVAAPAPPPMSAADLSTLTAKAEAGDAVAQTALGRLYLSGQSLKSDVKAAVKWFQLAAGKNNPEAQATLGELTQAGQGVPKNLEEAARLYRLAAENGSVAGQYNLAFLYESGQGVPQDQAQATKWYQLAAEGGDPIAQYDLGQRYELGVGVAIDHVQSCQWLTLAAAQGQKDSVKLLSEVKAKLSDAEMAEATRQVQAFVQRTKK